MNGLNSGISFQPFLCGESRVVVGNNQEVRHENVWKSVYIYIYIYIYIYMCVCVCVFINMILNLGIRRT